MLTRIWRSNFDLARLEELARFAGQVSAPMFRRLPGYLGHIYSTSGSTWITQTFWESQAHIEEAEASGIYQDVVDQIMATGFLGDEQTTEVFEVADYSPPPL